MSDPHMSDPHMSDPHTSDPDKSAPHTSAPGRTQKIVMLAAAAIGISVGAAGVASAVSNTGSDTPESEAAEDAAEQALLESFPVSPEEAKAAALAVVPGTVDEVEISDDTADPVFEVEIIDANGQEIEVTVDPNTGAVLGQQVDGPDDDGPDDDVPDSDGDGDHQNENEVEGQEVAPGN